MNDLPTFAAFAIGAILGALIMGVWMATVAHDNFVKYQMEKAKVFALDQQLLDALEGNVDRHWQMVTNGTELTVQRRRIEPQASQPVIDLTTVEDE